MTHQHAKQRAMTRFACGKRTAPSKTKLVGLWSVITARGRYRRQEWKRQEARKAGRIIRERERYDRMEARVYGWSNLREGYR